MKRSFCSFFLTLIMSFALAQGGYQHEVDSLLQLSSSAPRTPDQVSILNEISEVYMSRAPTAAKDSALIYSNLAADLAREINDTTGLAEALHDLGKYHIGISVQPAIATQYLLESLELFKQVDRKDGVSKCYMQLGLISYILQYFEDAIENFHLSVEAMEYSTSIYLMAIAYTEIDSFSQAKHYFNHAIRSFSEQNNYERLAECHLYLGRLYLKTGDLDSAFYFINMAIDDNRAFNDSMILVRPYAFLAGVYLESGDIQNALAYAKSSYEMEIAKTIRARDEIGFIQATKILSEAYELTGDYKNALFYSQLYNKENNRFTQGSTKQKVANMKSMFEFEQALSLEKIRQQKDKEIAEQQIAKERILRNSFLVGSVLLLLLLVLLYSRFNLKKRAISKLSELNEIITLEKKRSDELLLNILPEETAIELKQKGYADAKQIDHVTVLFTDFQGFTALSSQLSPRELVEELHACFSEFDRICETYGIEKIKTIGDAYMAAGGLPTPNQSHAKDVTMAALDMIEVVGRNKAKNSSNSKPFFEIRIGVHTGPVVAGIVGVKKFQYDVWGDTVNTASRMENNSETGQVNISQATFALLKDAPDLIFENRGMIKVKGKGEMAMYFVSKKSKSQSIEPADQLILPDGKV